MISPESSLNTLPSVQVVEHPDIKGRPMNALKFAFAATVMAFSVTSGLSARLSGKQSSC